MKSAFIFVLALVLLMIVSAVYAMETIEGSQSAYGFAEVWFGDKNATSVTIEGVKLKIGEPVDIKVTVTSKVNGHVFVELGETGVTKAFNVLSGPSKEDESIDNYDITKGWSKTYTWKVAPNGAWVNGGAPINLFVQFFNAEEKESKALWFTIANPYILDEQYIGSTPASQTSTAAETPKTDSAQNTAPFSYMYLILVGAVVIVVLVLFRMMKK